MSTPESGFCTLDEYEDGKQFIVTPDRLCLEGIYTFAYRFREPKQADAYRRPVKIKQVNHQRKYSKVIVEFSDPPKTFPYKPSKEGYITWPIGDVDEGYFKHRHGGLDDELEDLVVSLDKDVDAKILETETIAG